ncbi:MAG: MobA/MobL family protein [Nitrososphaerota archaeon]|nr:MobA/MobL family protein [Nitrososphaerota archaeon]
MLPIYYFDGNIIGRSSGRSSVGAAAYRAGEKLRSHAAGSAAYRAGDELREGEGVIVHDYTRKKGVRHSEIMLPQNAPSEYKDRETLWNAVEKRERRKDAQLAREFVVGLQREFELREQIEVLREYIKENFVDKGMCADFAIHDKGDGNPHAHIMLTTRHVTPDGFGKKNVEWNDKTLFLGWRENWADVNNRMFERKGLAERIDHRSYMAQGIDREPMVHLGYEAAALEKKGIKTERGNHNREVQKRNEERAALKEVPQLKAEKIEQDTEELRKIAKEAKLEDELQKIREAQKIARYIENPIESKPEPSFVSALEKQFKAEKAMQHIEKMQAQQNNAEQTAKRMNDLKEKYIELEMAKNLLIAQHNKDKLELPPLEYRAELLEEHAKNIEVLQGRAEQLREVRQNVRMLEFAKKKDLDEKLAHATQELGRAQDFFKNRFSIDPSQAYEELKRLQEEIRTRKEELKAKQIIIHDIRKKQETIELAYHTQKLLNETRPDHEQINSLIEQMRKPPESAREQQIQQRIEHQLNVIGDTSFQKVIDNLPPYEAQILTNIREQAKEHKRQIELSKERDRTIERSR